MTDSDKKDSSDNFNFRGVPSVSSSLREALAGNAITYMACLHGDGSAINI